MAQQDQQQAVVQQLFPPPPHYFKLFTEDADGSDERPLPPPPPPPIVGEYQNFGELYTTEDGLPALQVRRLYTINDDGTIDFKAQLQLLHRELVANVLELLNILVDKPSGYARQVENVGLVLRNMMHATAQMRPLQARETIAVALKHGINEKEQATEELQQALVSARQATADIKQRLKHAEERLQSELRAAADTTPL